MAARHIELQHTDCHEQRTGAEAGAQPEVVLRQRNDQRTQESPEVDADVEDSEACIETRAAFRIQIGHHGADVWLQQADAEDDHHQAQIKAPRRRGRCEQRIAERDAKTADHDGALRADEPIRDPASGQCREVDAGVVQPVDGRSGLVIETEPPGRHGGHQE